MQNTFPSAAEQAAGLGHQHTSGLVSSWASARRRYTPWAYAHLRSQAVIRFAVGIFLIVLSALLLTYGAGAWAAIPMAGAVLNIAIASLDTGAARYAAHRA
jgi:hypothetical protein